MSSACIGDAFHLTFFGGVGYAVETLYGGALTLIEFFSFGGI